MIHLTFEDEWGKSKECDFPSSWDEIPRLLIWQVFRDYEDCRNGKMSPRQLLVRFVYGLLGLGQPSRLVLNDDNAAANLAGLCQMAEFIFEDGAQYGRLPSLSYDSIKNPMPFLWCKAKRLYGPGELCMNLTFGEYRNAATALNGWLASGDVSELDECLAHLWRPGSMKTNKAGRKVSAVSPATFPSEIKRLSNVQTWIKMMLAAWFSNCISYLQTKPVTIGGEEVDMALLYSSPSQGGPETTLNDLLVQLAKDGSMGSVSDVDAAPLPLVLMHMWVNYKDNKRMEKAYELARKNQ